MHGTTIFVGAFLLFQLQPIIGKYLLPWYGGGPGVWTTCLFFFQIMLLAGYCYAHVLTRYFSSARQLGIHAVLIAGALACLPIIPPAQLKPAGEDQPWIGILLLLTRTVGLPYLLLASTGPLVQAWYSRRSTLEAPYRLYALSNAGSFLALLSYPSFFERYLARQTQAKIWGWGLVAYCLCCAWCAFANWRQSRSSKWVEKPLMPVNQRVSEERRPVTLPQRLLWLLWPACGSALLLAITNKLCLDVAVFPFLWIAPLSLYLLSFVITFDNPRWYSRRVYALPTVAALGWLCWALFNGATWSLAKQIPAYCGSLLICCLVCHGEVFRLRPGAGRLTEFYLLIAAGGALGGLFVSLLSPAIFDSYCELNWSLAAFGILVAVAWTKRRASAGKSDNTPGRTTLALRVAAARARTGEGNPWHGIGTALLWLGSLALAATLWLQARRENPDIVHRSRNFYGVLTVFEHRRQEPLGHHYLLQHGRITHGLQLAAPELQALATTYYGSESGLGLALTATIGRNRKIGAIGLGTGTLAAYAHRGDSIEFYEINPAVRLLATNPFTYLQQCPGACTLTPGDARLSMEREPDRHFDLLALDAFSSDAIPVHLLTREAFQIYLRHLDTAGVMAVHISNHFLDLEPVVLGLAADLGLTAAVIDHNADPAQWWIYSSTWVLLTRDKEFLSQSSIRAAAKGKVSARKVPIWTDDYCSVLGILK